MHTWTEEQHTFTSALNATIPSPSGGVQDARERSMCVGSADGGGNDAPVERSLVEPFSPLSKRLFAEHNRYPNEFLG